MGSQVMFRCVGDDLLSLDRQVQRVGLVVVLDYVPEPVPQVIPSLSAAFETRRAVVLALPSDLARIEWGPGGAPDVWVARTLQGPVLDYMPGHREDGWPRSRREASYGRFWIDTSWWDAGGDVVSQSPDLLSASRRLMSWVRRHWVGINMVYESPRAHELMEADARANAWRDKWRVAYDEPAVEPRAQIESWKLAVRQHTDLRDEDVRVGITGPYADDPGRVRIEVRDRPPRVEPD